MQSKSQNSIRALKPSNARAVLRDRFGEEVAAIVDTPVDADWEDVRQFEKEIDFNQY